MEQAHAAYPQERTIEGVQRLLRANLTTQRAARARAIVTELQTQAARDPLTRPQLESRYGIPSKLLFILPGNILIQASFKNLREARLGPPEWNFPKAGRGAVQGGKQGAGRVQFRAIRTAQELDSWAGGTQGLTADRVFK